MERLRSGKGLLSSKGAMRVVSCLERVNSAVGECGDYVRVDLLFPLASKGLQVEIYFVPNQVSQPHIQWYGLGS